MSCGPSCIGLADLEILVIHLFSYPAPVCLRARKRALPFLVVLGFALIETLLSRIFALSESAGEALRGVEGSIAPARFDQAASTCGRAAHRGIQERVEWLTHPMNPDRMGPLIAHDAEGCPLAPNSRVSVREPLRLGHYLLDGASWLQSGPAGQRHALFSCAASPMS